MHSIPLLCLVLGCGVSRACECVVVPDGALHGERAGGHAGLGGRGARGRDVGLGAGVDGQSGRARRARAVLLRRGGARSDAMWLDGCRRGVKALRCRRQKNELKKEFSVVVAADVVVVTLFNYVCFGVYVFVR